MEPPPPPPRRPPPPPPPPPPCPPPRYQVLPRPSELSSLQKQFLDQNLSTHQDLHTNAPLLLAQLTKSYADSESNFINLQKNLTRRTVSWVYHSFGAKSSLANLNYMLENLSLHSSPCWSFILSFLFFFFFKLLFDIIETVLNLIIFFFQMGFFQGRFRGMKCLNL